MEATGKYPEAHVKLFVDGACKDNGGENSQMGVGAYIVSASGKFSRRLSQALGPGTNQKAEILAVYHGLDLVPEPKRASTHVEVYSDSAYAIGCLAPGTNWNPKTNLTEIAMARAMIGQFASVEFKKVKGHAGHTENEMVDKLANGAANGGG